MPALDRNVKVTFGNYGTSVTKINLSRHKLRCCGGALYCPKSPNFSTKSREDLNYHIAKKQSVSRPSITYKCKLCHADFPGFYGLRQHKNTHHGTQIGFRANNINVEDIVGAVDDQSLREDLVFCKQFLTDTEVENGRHRVFNFAMSSFDVSLLNDKLDYVFKELKCAAKVNLAFGIVLKNVEDGMCRCFYAHENNAIMERAKLVCTQADMTNLKEKMQKMDIVDLSTRERSNTNWKFCKLTTLTVFASLLKDMPMGCNDTVLPEPVLENHNVNCLTFKRSTRQPYNDNLCLFRALSLHLHGNENWRRKHPNFSIFPEQLRGRRTIKVSRCSRDWYSESRGNVAFEYFSLWHWIGGWGTDWWALSKKYSKVWKKSQAFTLQQSHLLRKQYQRIVQKLPV